MTNTTMKAIRIHAYGGPEVMTYEDAPVPTPEVGQVLVRVAAAGINPIDGKIRSGDMKDMMPVTFPYTLGFDLAGTVVSVGSGVSDFAPGQAVYGHGDGTYAEYAIAPAATLAASPKSLSLSEAASVPMASCTSWQGIFDMGGLEANQTILIHGAAGGVGMFAVQFAKWKGAKVIGTASGPGVAFAKELGADTVIDYKAARFEDEIKDVDVILDLIGGDTQTRSFGVLKPGGILVSTVQPPSEDAAKSHGVRATMVQMQSSSALLTQIAGLLDAGKVHTTVTKTIPLSAFIESQKPGQTAPIQGKTILQVE